MSVIAPDVVSPPSRREQTCGPDMLLARWNCVEEGWWWRASWPSEVHLIKDEDSGWQLAVMRGSSHLKPDRYIEDFGAAVQAAVDEFAAVECMESSLRRALRCSAMKG